MKTLDSSILDDALPRVERSAGDMAKNAQEFLKRFSYDKHSKRKKAIFGMEVASIALAIGLLLGSTVRRTQSKN